MKRCDFCKGYFQAVKRVHGVNYCSKCYFREFYNFKEMKGGYQVKNANKR